MPNVKSELNQLSNREMVAYWNIMQMGCRMLGNGQDNAHLPIVAELLSERHISHQVGKLINAL